MEQVQLLQEEVVALKEKTATGQRLDNVEQKLDALRGSVEQIKSALAP